MMKVIIAGSRSIEDYNIIDKAIKESKYDICCVISGTAHGVDKLGEQWADKNNVAVLRMPADWKQYGKAAGPIRNAEMAKVADAAVIIWDGESRGTLNMIENIKKLNKPYYVYRTDVRFLIEEEQKIFHTALLKSAKVVKKK
jgi:hypothetical protein